MILWFSKRLAKEQKLPIVVFIFYTSVMKLTFCGGVKEATGANYLLESGSTKILVDCGMPQEGEHAKKPNDFLYDPKDVATVFVTHAHIDHTGRLPELVRRGFSGDIISTPPTKEIGELLLFDSERVLREHAKDEETAPPYTEDDVRKTLELWKTIPYQKEISVGSFTVKLINAGHALGSSSIVVIAEGKTVVFSGDLGNARAPFLRSTEFPERADYALIESVYGDRLHKDIEKRKDLLEDFIEEVSSRGGVLLIPSFAFERTQEMIFEMDELVEHGRIPRVPVFVDSPLAIRLTELFKKYMNDSVYFSDAAVKLAGKGDGIFNFHGLRVTPHRIDSEKIREVPPPKVIVAGSGMSQGGRILFHEREYLPDPKSAILFVGYQADGTRGRMIQDGAKEIELFGEKIPVRCEVRTISGYSAHADQAQLMKWAGSLRDSLTKLFVVQGEEAASNALSVKIRDELAINTEVPSLGESVVL